MDIFGEEFKASVYQIHPLFIYLLLFLLVQKIVLYDAWQIEKEPIQNCTLLNFIYFSTTTNHAGLLSNHYKNDYT